MENKTTSERESIKVKKRDKSGSDARSSIEMHKLNTADPEN